MGRRGADRRIDLQLDRRTENAVRGGHPWLYQDVLESLDAAPKAGGLVTLRDALGTPMGLAMADGVDRPGAPALRVLSLDRDPPPLRKLLLRRIALARELRARLIDPATTAFRLTNGEGDELPGLVIDRFGPVLVVRPDSPAWETHGRLLVEALRSEGGGGIETILLRPKGGESRVLWGAEPPDSVVIQEHERRYQVRPGYGQKTGFFLDQRDNRSTVQRLVRPGDRTLDLFSFTGGFSTALAVGGAAHVTSVDLAASLMADVQSQLRLNGIPLERHEPIAADIFKWLPQRGRAKGPRYDVVVCDPPALAHKKKDLPNAREAYRRLHAALAPVLAPRGLLVTASCTARLSADDLLEDAIAGLRKGGRRVSRELLRGGAGADHPVTPALPQLRYLSCLVLALD
ncbi:MAG: class I SAM-dependent rRNA methyltransferase [Deltaproteobacteria bacterium]|nr:class I SAM-dependent rRNA methyltransferase [Deltaproteobacteria bacterium]